MSATNALLLFELWRTEFAEAKATGLSFQQAYEVAASQCGSYLMAGSIKEFDDLMCELYIRIYQTPRIAVVRGPFIWKD